MNNVGFACLAKLTFVSLGGDFDSPLNSWCRLTHIFSIIYPKMRQLKIHGIYQHYKGDCYIVEGLARHSETGEEMVVYRQLYGDGGLYVRPKRDVLIGD